MERRQLEYFVAVVELGGFSVAARALHVAQPSLSRSIGNLERELGVTLFHRIGRSAVLSAAGETLVARARLVLRDLDGLRAAASALGDGAAGRVEVAATPSSGLDPVIEVIALLRGRHPGVTVGTTSAQSAAEVVAMVAQGLCEVGVCGAAEQPAGAGLVAHHLRDEELLLVTSPGLLDVTGPAVRREHLRGMRFVVPAQSTAVRAFFDRLAGHLGDMTIVAQVGDRSMVLPLVLRGVGVGLMPDGWADLAARTGADVYRFDPAERIPQWLVHRATLSVAARAFVDTTLAASRP